MKSWLQLVLIIDQASHKGCNQPYYLLCLFSILKQSQCIHFSKT